MYQELYLLKKNEYKSGRMCFFPLFYFSKHDCHRCIVCSPTEQVAIVFL